MISNLTAQGHYWTAWACMYLLDSCLSRLCTALHEEFESAVNYSVPVGTDTVPEIAQPMACLSSLQLLLYVCAQPRWSSTGRHWTATCRLRTSCRRWSCHRRARRWPPSTRSASRRRTSWPKWSDSWVSEISGMAAVRVRLVGRQLGEWDKWGDSWVSEIIGETAEWD